MNSFQNINKKRVVSTLFLYIVILLPACDFKSPEKWETPTWYLPLTVPFIDTKYSFEGIAQDSTIVEDTLNKTLYITFSDDIVEPGGDRPGINDDVFNFKLPGQDLSNLIDLEIPPIPLLPPTTIPDAVPPFDIPIVSFVSDPASVIASGCLAATNIDKPIINELPVGSVQTFPILSLFSSELSSIKIFEKSIIDSLHFITITQGKLGVKITNNFPFPVKEFNLKYINYEFGGQERELRHIIFTDIPTGADYTNNGNITASDPVQFGDSLKIELSIELDISNDYTSLNPNSHTCPLLFPTEDGWILDPSYLFTIELLFNIPAESATNIICTTNEIIIDTTNRIPMEIPGLSMEIKGGKIKDTISTIQSNELNYIKLVSSNTLFSTPTISIEFDNFFNHISGEDVSLLLGGPIPTTGLDVVYDTSLAQYMLGTPSHPDSVLKEISIGVNVAIDKISRSPLLLGSPMNLKISQLLMSQIELSYLTAVVYEMGFDTPSSNIDAVPQGGIGLQFYDVQLILDMYTQIGIPIQFFYDSPIIVRKGNSTLYKI